MYYTDYHCHSILSMDGRVPLSVLAEHMLQAGIREMCLTDHCDVLDENGRPISGYDWPAAIAQYDETVPQFEGRLKLRLGLEYGMGHLDPALSEQILSQPRLDFVIGSVHNLSPERGGIDLFFADLSTPRSCAAALDDYFTSMEKLAATPYFDILGHIIYPLRYMKGMARIDPYLDRVTEILRTVIASGRGIELNTYRGRTVAEWEPVLRRYKELGGELITVGSDAHDPACAGGGVPAAYDLLRSLGFRAVCTYERRKPAFIDL